MSYKSHIAASSRAFDHLYDPIFKTSDPKNVHKENCIALTRSAPIHVYPVYKAMFSELCHEQRNCYAYQKNVLPYYSSDNISGSPKLLAVTGADRAKFFSNPVGNIRTINVGLDIEDQLETTSTTKIIEYKTTSMQTKFRESSAQTKPWLPEVSCFSPENVDEELPEVVYVTDMIDTASYPGFHEVEIIERARKRRSWENALPSITAPNEIQSRVAAVEAFEWEEWVVREKDINECQQARIKIVSDLIVKREKKHLDATNQKIENCNRKMLSQCKKQKDVLIRNYQRNMRKLDLAQHKSLNQNKINDPVMFHFEKKFEYSIPKIRLDAFSKKRTQIEYTNNFEKKFNLLEKDNATHGDLKKYMKSNKRDLWLPKGKPKEIERQMKSEKYLKRLHQTLEHLRFKKNSREKLSKSLIFNEPLQSKNQSSSSLVVQVLDEETETRYVATARAHRHTEGRAIQGIVSRGMEGCKNFIEEARKTNSVDAVKKLIPKEFIKEIDGQDQILKEYKRLEEALKNDKKLQEELKRIENSDPSNMLHFLEKELKRLEGEKKDQATYLLAEHERYKLKSLSMGGIHLQKQFKNDALTLYLENILIAAIHRVNDEISRDYIRMFTNKIDQRASKSQNFGKTTEKYCFESNTEHISGKLLNHKENRDDIAVIELLKDNLIPEIKNSIRNQQFIENRKHYLLAAGGDAHKEKFEETKQEAEYEI
ncbi:CLUMA_CG000111, isoform A, partial [Clunio marinus]